MILCSRLILKLLKACNNYIASSLFLLAMLEDIDMLIKGWLNPSEVFLQMQNSTSKFLRTLIGTHFSLTSLTILLYQKLLDTVFYIFKLHALNVIFLLITIFAQKLVIYFDSFRGWKNTFQKVRIDRTGSINRLFTWFNRC